MEFGRSSRQRFLPGFEREAPRAARRVAPAWPDISWLDSFAGEVLKKHQPGLELPPLRTSSRMTRTLGSYDLQSRRISLSARLLAFGSKDECRRILLHELAHAIVHHRTPGAPGHGREFRAVCRELGVKGSRVSDVPVHRWGSAQRYAYRCADCGDTILRKRAVRKVRCDCGAKLAPRRAARVALSGEGPHVLIGYVDLANKPR